MDGMEWNGMDTETPARAPQAFRAFGGRDVFREVEAGNCPLWRCSVEPPQLAVGPTLDVLRPDYRFVVKSRCETHHHVLSH